MDDINALNVRGLNDTSAAHRLNAAMGLGFGGEVALAIVSYRPAAPVAALNKPTAIEGIGNPYFVSSSLGGWGATFNPTHGLQRVRECVHLPVSFQAAVERVDIVGTTPCGLPDMTERDFREAFPKHPWDCPSWTIVRRGL
jgi:hypothetical protein